MITLDTIEKVKYRIKSNKFLSRKQKGKLLAFNNKVRNCIIKRYAKNLEVS